MIPNSYYEDIRSKICSIFGLSEKKTTLSALHGEHIFIQVICKPHVITYDSSTQTIGYDCCISGTYNFVKVIKSLIKDKTLEDVCNDNHIKTQISEALRGEHHV